MPCGKICSIPCNKNSLQQPSASLAVRGRRGTTVCKSKRRKRQVLAAIALLIWILSVAGLVAATLHPSIGEAEAKAAVSLAKLLADSPTTLVDMQLSTAGFIAPVAAGEWSNFPIIRKLETAYLAAESGAKGGGGELLRRLSDALAAKYDSAKAAPELAAFRSNTPPGQNRPPIPFGTIPVDTREWKADPATEKAIFAISRYCDGGPFGGATGVLEFYFNLPTHQAYDILRTSRTTSEAIARGLTFVPEAERKPRLEVLVAHVDKHYGETARAERDLDPWRRKITIAEARPKIFREQEPAGAHAVEMRQSPRIPGGNGRGGRDPGSTGGETPTPTTPITPPPGSGGGDAAPALAGRSRTSVDYERFVRATYGGDGAGLGHSAVEGFAQGIAYGIMQGLAEGFGGVVMGNSVHTVPGLVPRQIVWIAPPPGEAAESDAMGRLVLRFDRNVEKVYGPVTAEDAWAAYHIVFEGIDGINPMRPNNGVGLVGVEGDHLRPRLSLTSENQLATHETFRVIIHPAIARLTLGESTLLSDVLPISPSVDAPSQLQAIVKTASGASTADSLGMLFEDIDNWKLTDAKITIGTDGDRLTVSRTADPKHPRSAGYLKTCFLTMNGFRYGKLNPATSVRFDDLLPDILASSADYARVNQFAAVLAVFRWARMGNAQFVNSPQSPSGKEVPAWVEIEDRGIHFIAYETPADTLAGFHRDIEVRLASIAAKYPPAAAAFLGHERTARDAVAKLAEAYSNWDTETQRLQDEWDSLNKSVERAFPAAAAVERRAYAELTKDGFDGEEADPHTAQGLLDMRKRYSPASVAEFARLRSEIQKNKHPEERQRFESAREALKSDDAIRIELVALLPPAAKATYEEAAAKQGLASKAGAEGRKQLIDLSRRLRDLNSREEQQVKNLSPSLQAAYRKLDEQVLEYFVTTSKESQAARNGLLAFRQKHLSEIQTERTDIEQQIETARKEARDGFQNAARAREQMDASLNGAYPALKEWLRLASYSTKLLREVGYWGRF